MALLLAGCGVKNEEIRMEDRETAALAEAEPAGAAEILEDTVGDEVEDLMEEPVGDEAEGLVEESAEEAAEEFAEQSYLFQFVDVFGEEYETEIKVDFPKSPYSEENFQFADGKTSYADEEYSTRQGIDVSNYQGYIDWNKVKAAGIDFAILRIGYRGYGEAGNIKLDGEFRRNIENARAAGLDIGVYFFAQAVNEEEAREEAEFVIKNLEGYELQLPVVYDPESILDAPARTDHVSGEQFTKNTIVFCETVRSAGYSPMIYSNMLWEAFEFDMEKLNIYPFWYADYEQFPQTPYAYEIWQYSNTGHVDGVSGAVDLNVQFIRNP